VIHSIFVKIVEIFCDFIFIKNSYIAITNFNDRWSSGKVILLPSKSFRGILQLSLRLLVAGFIWFL